MTIWAAPSRCGSGGWRRWLGLGAGSDAGAQSGAANSVGQVAVLDGGLQAWIAVGGALSTAVPVFRPGSLEVEHDDERWLDTLTLQRMLATDQIQVIDARARERFIGEVEPIDPVAGHIPGAVNLPLTENLDKSGRFLSPGQLRARFEAVIGERPPTQIVHSCGSGVNACHNLLAMELAGLHGSRLYAGSWSEWIRDPTRPVATGAD
jgi:thiosulfate/3-mercaptopyruvate sulfurtransferase